MSKITIIEPNTSDKDQIRNYLVKGERGDDGVSPTFETSKTGDTATITITDVEGEHEVELKDGVSPTVETSKSGKVTTVTITDAEGTHTATINDGEDGATTNIINSEILTDKTTQTYSANIVDNLLDDKANTTDVIVKDNIIILTGSIEIEVPTTDYGSAGETRINYPTGCNENNLIPIGILSRETLSSGNLSVWGSGRVYGNDTGNVQTYVAKSIYGTTTPSVELYTNNIRISATNVNNYAKTVEFKIALLKIS